MKHLFILGAVVLLFASCGRGGGVANSELTDTLYAPKYASGFAIFGVDGGTVVEVKNPWQGADGVVHRVFLSKEGKNPPEGFTGEVIAAPVGRVVCMSSSYVAFIDALGADTVVKGVSGAKFITNENIAARHKSGEVVDVGYDNGLNYELIASLKPDVVFVYGIYGENSAVTDKLREMGVKVVYVGDYVENDPLGKAEWIVFMGEFVGARERAEEIFDKVSSEYLELKNIIERSKFTSRPSIMLNAPWRDSWFVPGDRSYMVRLIEDAGGAYACAGVDSDKSRPISTENAYVMASGADLWLNPGTFNSLKELTAANPNFAKIPVLLQGNVYNNNARRTEGGGSDFWESGAVYPHLVLKDMIRIIHPELLPNHSLYYFWQMK